MVALPGQPGPGIDTWDQPLVDAWFTPGFTAQHKNQLTAPNNGITSANWPVDVPYVHLSHQYMDFGNGNPLGGFLTFWPSSACIFTESGSTWSLIRRPCGVTPWGVYGNQWNNSYSDSGYIFLRFGVLDVYLIASDASGLSVLNGHPLTYHVREHWLGGSQFDITAPEASADPVDIYSLMVADTQEAYPFDPRAPLTLSLAPDTVPDVTPPDTGIQIESAALDPGFDTQIETE